jgi:hypothetical protein
VFFFLQQLININGHSELLQLRQRVRIFQLCIDQLLAAVHKWGAFNLVSGVSLRPNAKEILSSQQLILQAGGVMHLIVLLGVLVGTPQNSWVL